MTGLAGKVILITGAASGIGLATARAVETGGSIAIGTYRQTSGTCLALGVCDPVASDRTVESILACHGRIDGLVTSDGV